MYQARRAAAVYASVRVVAENVWSDSFVDEKPTEEEKFVLFNFFTIVIISPF